MAAPSTCASEVATTCRRASLFFYLATKVGYYSSSKSLKLRPNWTRFFYDSMPRISLTARRNFPLALVFCDFVAFYRPVSVGTDLSSMLLDQLTDRAWLNGPCFSSSITSLDGFGWKTEAMETDTRRVARSDFGAKPITVDGVDY